MMSGMCLINLLLLFIVLGFALIVWSAAVKESGALKITGQIIAGVIAVLIIIVFLYGSIYGKKLHKQYGMHMMGKCPMMDSMDKSTDMKMHEGMQMPEKGTTKK